MADSDAVLSEYNPRGGSGCGGVGGGELDVAGALQRHLPLALAILTLLAVLLAVCLYYCNAYHRAQAKLIEANVWRRVSRNLEKGGAWRTGAWWEEENEGGWRGRRRESGDGRGAETKPRTYVRDNVAKITSEKLKNIGGYSLGNSRSRVDHHEMTGMKELKRGSEDIMDKAKELTLQSKTLQANVLGKHLSPYAREISKRPRMPLPTEIDSLYSVPNPKSALSSSDFGERLIYDAVEVPEFISRYRTPTVGPQDKMLYEKMDLGGIQKHRQL